MASADPTSTYRGYETLVDRLSGQGLADQRLTDVMRRHPRARFIPDQIWAGEPTMVQIDRATDPDGWLAAVTSDIPIVTQVAGSNRPTSSSSMPTMVARMIHHLDPGEGQRVLEIGAGTGWNAALLTHLVGEHGQVVSIEIDPEVADHARKRLADAGADALVIVGDGERGFPGEPYDRIIATCSVYRVPKAWVWQTRPGGVIVTPWRAPFTLVGLLLRLTVDGDGRAEGRFVDWAAFMASRPQQEPDEEVLVPDSGGDTRQSDIHPGLVLNDDAEIAAGFLMGSCQWWREDTPDGDYARLDDLATGSWAVVGPVPETGTCPVRQGGPRRLWDEVEAAYRWWVDQHRPAHTRYGLSINDGRSWVWLDEPAQTVATIPTSIPQ